MIVDDEEISTGLLVTAQKHKFEVLEVTSGEVCFLQISAFLPDLILLDINMPEMDDFQACA